MYIHKQLKITIDRPLYIFSFQWEVLLQGQNFEYILEIKCKM